MPKDYLIINEDYRNEFREYYKKAEIINIYIINQNKGWLVN